MAQHPKSRLRDELLYNAALRKAGQALDYARQAFKRMGPLSGADELEGRIAAARIAFLAAE